MRCLTAIEWQLADGQGITEAIASMRRYSHPLAKSVIVVAPGFVTDRHPAKADGFTRLPRSRLIGMLQFDATAFRWAAGAPLMVMVRLVPRRIERRPNRRKLQCRNLMCAVLRLSTELISARTSSSWFGLGSDGVPAQKVRFRRDPPLQFFERAAPAIVGMDSCAGSQWTTRKIQALGHKVRLIPAQFVKPYVKLKKNDIIDTEAIAEAVTRPTMRLATLKSEEQA